MIRPSWPEWLRLHSGDLPKVVIPCTYQARRGSTFVCDNVVTTAPNQPQPTASENIGDAANRAQKDVAML